MQRKNSEGILKVIVFLLFFVWVGVLFVRSGIYMGRIINETKSYLLKKPEFFPSITPCSLKPELSQVEELHLWYYRNLGVVCDR